MTDYMICQNQDNHLLYALKHDRFWFWDKHQNKWVPSDWAAQQYAKAQTKEPDLTQEDWLGYCFGILMDDYEVPDAVVKALRALPNKEEPPCKVNTTAPNADAAVTMAAPAATLAEETSTTQADANSCPPGPCSPAGTSAAISSLSDAETACSAAEFDYSGLDEQTVNDLHLAERECAAGRRLAEAGLRRMADGVAIAHEALVPNWDNSKHGNRGEDTFRRWCESIGVSKSAAYRLLQVTALFDNSSPEQQKILDSLSPSLLYAAAKPTAPADLVQAVKSGDITTHKQYQDLLKENQQLRADRVNALNAAAAAEAARDAALADVDGLHEQNRQLQAAATGAQESYRTAHKNEDSALRRATEAEQRAKEAEARAADAEKTARRMWLSARQVKPTLKSTAKRARTACLMQLKSWPKHPAHRTQSCCASWPKPSSSWTRPAPMPMPANGSWMPQPMPWTAFAPCCGPTCAPQPWMPNCLTP